MTQIAPFVPVLAIRPFIASLQDAMKTNARRHPALKGWAIGMASLQDAPGIGVQTGASVFSIRQEIPGICIRAGTHGVRIRAMGVPSGTPCQ